MTENEPRLDWEQLFRLWAWAVLLYCIFMVALILHSLVA